MKRARKAHIFTTDGQLRVEPQVEHQSSQPTHRLGTEAQEALRISSEKWDAALTLINFSRQAWVNHNTLNPHTPDVEAATVQLLRLQREDAELARHLGVEDVQAALALVKASREDAYRQSITTVQELCNERNVETDVMTDELDRGLANVDFEYWDKSWVIDGVRGPGA